MNEQKELIKIFIVDNFLFGEAKKLSVETQLFDTGILDSTGILELIAFIEENFNITITDQELIQSNFSSINAIEKFIQSKNNHTSS